MKTIQSFTVDHDFIVPGLYVSRVDGDVTTYDLRTRKPNGEDLMSHLIMHSMEHLFATYIRNSDMGEQILYFGPMGCRTGFYLLVRNADNEKVLAKVKEILGQIVAHDGPMFGATRKECGNYRELSVEAAKEEAARYLAALETGSAQFVYPTEG